jgi:GNAT superfamily N-acetyltransferase
MSVEKATQDDLDAILGWLELEYTESGEGFWCNRSVIRGSLKAANLWVIRRDGKAVAFQVGDYAADIACVRKDMQREGLGTELFEASLARAIRDNVNLLSGECSPRTSLPFWEKHGFERYGDVGDWFNVNVRRILQRQLEIPTDRPSVEATISFYPESASYSHDDVEPVAVHKVRGARLDDGSVKLERRVIGVMGDATDGDLVVKIVVDGVQRCFCKAKYPKAKEAGVQHDYRGGTFYVDVVELEGLNRDL